jgi:hypothetical protein
MIQEKEMRSTTVLAIFLVCTMLAGMVLAESGEPAVQETQGFVTSTAMHVFGTATESDSIVTDINDGYQAGEWDPAPPMAPTSVIYSSSYSENTLADQGLVIYQKTIGFDTAGMAEPNQYNLVTARLVDFAGSGTGRMTSDEQATMDGAGTGLDTIPTLLCPFATIDEESIIPPFCNIVQEGSSVDLTAGSLATGTRERFIMLAIPDTFSEFPFGMSWPYPLANPGTEADYSIALTGLGDIPASGSATAYINAHIQEGREIILDGDEEDYSSWHYPKAEDLAYSESTTVSGEITLFSKDLNYLGKVTGNAGRLVDITESG